MKYFIVENTWLPSLYSSHGWGNGYVIIPKGHPDHGKDYDDIEVDVHGGLTFSKALEDLKDWPCGDAIGEAEEGGWVVGFDTAHSGDTIENWPKEEVEKETIRLMEQLQAKYTTTNAVQ
jgi:hypothetical protein